MWYNVYCDKDTAYTYRIEKVFGGLSANVSTGRGAKRDGSLFRKLLTDAFMNMLQEQPIHAISIRDLCEKAGINRTTFYHHYGSEKMMPGFSEDYLRQQLQKVDACRLPLRPGETLDGLCDELFPVMFDPQVLPKRVNKADGADLIQTSACHFYEGVSQAEAEAFYDRMKKHEPTDTPPSFGLNSTLVKEDGEVREVFWSANGRYANAIRHIVYWLRKAAGVAENEQQRKVIELLISYYESGDLQTFNQYCIEWLQEHDSAIDFINGFIEVYGDPLGLKGSWEGLVEYIDESATQRTRTISSNAQWFEDHSPVDPRFRKPVVKGVSANVICAAMLGGDEYPSTAIGINLPNADWIRAEYGSKSITISNITDAYNKAAHGNGFREEFVIDQAALDLINKYGDVCDNLHTDLHECLGHGSGRLLPGVDPDALKAYGNTIEEARADLFGLYYIADPKLVELGIAKDRLTAVGKGSKEPVADNSTEEGKAKNRRVVFVKK